MLNRKNLPDPLSFYSGNGLDLVGRGKWRTTRCVFHGGSDSMRINSENGAWVCMTGCGARGGDVVAYYMAINGVDFVSAAKALGAWEEVAGSPSGRSRPTPISARDALEILISESNLLAITTLSIGLSKNMVEADRDRIIKSVSRINMISEYFRVK